MFSESLNGKSQVNYNSIKAILVLLLVLAASSSAQRQMENLSRGIVAVKQPSGGVYVGWRLFGTDPESITFNLYRITASGDPVRVNVRPISKTTNYIDHGVKAKATPKYFVRPVLDGKELAASAQCQVWEGNFLEIPIKPIEGYKADDASVADLDGDGEYEIVLHQASKGKDNSHSGITGTPVLDAYELDGRHMWRIDLGINIREGAHYTQFMVYDLDGDGRAEIACKTADGTKDGKGRIIGDKSKDWRTHDKGLKAYGRVLDGPEFLTIFDGQTGQALTTVDYIPNRYPIDGWGGNGGNGNNDSYGNRCDRFLACVAYLDGIRPSLVMCRGVYGRTVLAAWDWRGGKLTSRWVFDSGISYPPFEGVSLYSGMGGHSLSVADVDDDGKDEIVYHSMVVNDNGKGLYSTGWRHGDSMHISDMYPDRPGLEIFTIHENEENTVRFKSPAAAMRDARTGETIWKHSPGVDVGACLAADIDPRYFGYEAWGGPGGLRGSDGKEIGPNPRIRGRRFLIWWDGDLLRELLSNYGIVKWDWEKGTEEKLTALGHQCLVADLIGDWREELLVASEDGQSLRLYTTTIPTDHRIYTLMHDPQYRLSIAWQNVVYKRPQHPGFYLGHGMSPAPKPDIYLIGNGEAIRGIKD